MFIFDLTGRSRPLSGSH